MEVIGYDPYLTLESAWHLSAAVKKSETLEDLFAKSDYVTLHIPLNDKTKHTVSKELLAVAKKQMRLLNFARGELVDTDALLEAIENKTISHYITDFPAPDLLGNPNIILTPHLGASTPESEENCAEMAAVALREYLLYGNIKNSVNFPNCIVPYSGKPRITVSHANIVNMIGQLGSVFTKHHINVDKMVNNSKGELAYNIIVCDDLPQILPLWYKICMQFPVSKKYAYSIRRDNFMATVKPFAGIRPNPAYAAQIAALPYDVMNRQEAKDMAKDNPYSFLHIDRAEIDLPDDIDPYSDIVYQTAKQKLNDMIKNGDFIQDTLPNYYLSGFGIGRSQSNRDCCLYFH